MKIGIVGPCAAGKTTLETNLKKLGYNAHAISQEHSGVQTMWQQITQPDILIYLNVSLTNMNRRLKVNWEQSYIDEMNRRLMHAREHADFFIDTNPLTSAQVCATAIDFLNSIENQKS